MRPVLVSTVLLACSLALAACGEAPDTTAAADAVTNSDLEPPTKDAKPKTPAKPTCAKNERIFAPVTASQVSWVVVKGGNAPVVGTHPVTGSVKTKTTDPLTTASMDLTFGLDGALTGLALRDQRLRKLIFGADAKNLLSFQLTGVTTADGKPAPKLPDAGGVLPLALQGTLSLAGFTFPLEIPVLLGATPTGLRVTEGLDGIKLDLREQLGLGDALTALLALVPGVTTDGVLHLRFAIDLTDVCTPARGATP